MDLILAGLVSTMVVLMKLQHRELDKLSICRPNIWARGPHAAFFTAYLAHPWDILFDLKSFIK